MRDARPSGIQDALPAAGQGALERPRDARSAARPAVSPSAPQAAAMVGSRLAHLVERNFPAVGPKRAPLQGVRMPPGG